MPLWALLVGAVVIGSLVSGTSPLMVELGTFHISDKVMHYGAYLALSLLPVVGIADRRKAITTGLTMFLLGLALEGLQHFSPHRTVDIRDVAANGLGVITGVLAGLPMRRARLV